MPPLVELCDTVRFPRELCRVSAYVIEFPGAEFVSPPRSGFFDVPPVCGFESFRVCANSVWVLFVAEVSPESEFD